MSANLSDGTRKTLEQFGWQEGDPIPDSIGELLADIYAKNPNCRAAGLYVDITALGDEDINKIKTLLEEGKEAEKAKEAQEEYSAKRAGMSPEMVALYNKVADADSPVEIVDDRNTQSQEKTAGSPEETAEQPKKEKEKQPIPDVELKPEPVKEVFCPRCRWDMRQQYDVSPTNADKESFIACVLGGTRMQKFYSLMAGKYEVKFRSLLAEENKQIHRQLLLDQKNDEFFGDTEWFLRFFEYRMACSVETILADKKVIAIVPELNEIADIELPNKTDNKDNSPLERMRDYVVGDLLKMEITRRLVSDKFREFQRLYEALEAMALEPNFW